MDLAMAVFLILFVIVLLVLVLFDPDCGLVDPKLNRNIKCLFKKNGRDGSTFDCNAEETSENMNIGSQAVTINEFRQTPKGYQGKVILNGVNWNALCKKQKLAADIQVIVKKQDGLVLEIEPLEENIDLHQLV